MGGFSSVAPTANEAINKASQTLNSGSSSTPDQSLAPKPLDGVQNGYFSQPPSSSGKGGKTQGQQGTVTYSPTSGQPSMGSPNPYPNTIGPWDNANIRPFRGNGKGKGA